MSDAASAAVIRPRTGDLPRVAHPARRGRPVLIASYYFPPDAAVGALRLARFARLLPEFGWQPVVLTVRDELRDQGFDQQRLEGLENVEIVTTGEWPRLWRRMRALASRARATARSIDPMPSNTAAARSRRAGPVLATVKRWIVSLVVLFPDDKKHWAGLAAVRAVRLIRREKIRHVLTSGPPFSTHFVGVMSKWFTGARWIADFRDPWIDMLPDRFPDSRCLLSDAFERRMEALVVRTADRVIVTTPRMRDAFSRRYPGAGSDKFVCIPNGIDSDKFEPPVADRQLPFTITYAGSLYFDRTPEPLFRAVHDLLSSGRITQNDLRIQLIGRCDNSNGIQTQTLVAQYGLEPLVRILGPVPYHEALRLMRESHLLLALAPERHRLVVPAKLYDYLGSGTRILAIAEEGATSDLVRETGSGACFSESDANGLRDFLSDLINSGAFQSKRNEPASFPQFSARHLTSRLVALLAPASINAVGRVEVQG